MAYMLLPALFAVFFAAYLAYLFLWKKDSATLKSVLYPGLFFIAVWALLYYFVLK